MNFRETQLQRCELRANLVAEFLELHGRFPRSGEFYKDEAIGNFIAAARGLRSKMAMDALEKRGIDYTKDMRWPKYGERRVKVTD